MLLRGCPQLQILTTSREALGIGGEVARRVPSLAVPAPDQLPPIEQLTQFEAVQLFVERARAVQPAFVVTPQNAAAVAQLCWRLDGIPLAIELAAARVRVLTVEQIASRLGDRFRLLTGGSRSALRRQQTLSAAIDWSHDLLTEPERVLFRRLAVFAGGWSLEAAEGVCGDGQTAEGSGNKEDRSSSAPLAPLPVSEVLDLLTGLVDKSLVLAEEQSGDTRYRFLETIRQYAGEKLLAAGEAMAARDRHLGWFLEFAERAKPELIGPEQVAWLDRLEGERDNLRGALEWALERGLVERALRLAAAVWRLWHVRVNPGEGREWLLRVLAAPGAAAPTLARAEVLDGACQIVMTLQADDPVALRLGEECVAIYRVLGDRRGIALALRHLGYHAANMGNFERGEQLATEALAEAREANAPWAGAQSMQVLGMAAMGRGDYLLAGRHFETSLATFRSLGDIRAVASTLEQLAACAFEQSDYGASRTYAREALASARELRSRVRMCSAMTELGMIARQDGDGVQSRALLEEGLALARVAGDRWDAGTALLYLGWLARTDGDVGRAESLVMDGLADLRESGLPAIVAAAIGFQGVLAIDRGAHHRGARLLGAVVARQVPPLWLPPSDRQVLEASAAAARVALGEQEFAAAWAEGQAMRLEEAVDYALRDHGS